MESGSDSDAPEELTAVEGIKQHEDIKKVQRENIIRVAQEGKERRKKWAQRKTTVKTDEQEHVEVKEPENEEDEHSIPGMLPKNIVDLLAAREKQTFSSDSEEEINNQRVTTKKRKKKSFGPETVLLKDKNPSHCLQNAMEFLNTRRMEIPRSTSVLKNASHGLRLLSSKGNALSKR